MVLLMQALYDMTIPRLVQEDIDLFYPLLYGTFSGVELMEDTNEVLRSAVIS